MMHHLSVTVTQSLVVFALAGLFTGETSLWGQQFNWGGSIRGYPFLEVEEVLPDEADPEVKDLFSSRRDAELLILRFNLETSFSRNIELEIHPLLQFTSPSLTDSSQLAAHVTPTYLPLEHTFTDSTQGDLTGSLDRFNLKFDYESIRVVAGRQAVTWGVTYLWPALDLFGPFSPRRVDRDYKPGIDAVRTTIPFGDYSELEILAGVLGPSLKRDGTLGALTRIYLGPLDVGLMAGRFHRDTVAGGFLTADLSGTGLRAEVNWTQSGDPTDRLRDRRTFWRVAAGIDRQLAPSVSLTVEWSFNGYGAGEASGYLALAGADRIIRGEVNALGRWYSGISTSWQFHPLGALNNTLLVNWQDPSSLWLPTLSWSTGNNSVLLLGVQVSLGKELLPTGVPRSEYGSAPNTIFAGFQQYF
ncbi:MAG: hypothetical protein V3R94_03305 [Acidobacteriota bacterium]